MMSLVRGAVASEPPWLGPPTASTHAPSESSTVLEPRLTARLRCRGPGGRLVSITGAVLLFRFDGCLQPVQHPLAIALEADGSFSTCSALLR